MWDCRHAWHSNPISRLYTINVAVLPHFLNYMMGLNERSGMNEKAF